MESTPAPTMDWATFPIILRRECGDWNARGWHMRGTTRGASTFIMASLFFVVDADARAMPVFNPRSRIMKKTIDKLDDGFA